jgi:hypothetical protein
MIVEFGIGIEIDPIRQKIDSDPDFDLSDGKMLHCNNSTHLWRCGSVKESYAFSETALGKSRSPAESNDA